MPEIMSVQGPIDPKQLGFTSMHDHVLSILGPFFQSVINNEEKESLPINVDHNIELEDLFYLNHLGMRTYSASNWDLTDAQCMQQELSFFRQRGGVSILETSAPGIRGDIRDTKRIAAAAGVNIIASTGLYVGVSWRDAFEDCDNEAFKDYLRKEIEIGIDDTDIRAGHIKAAIRHGEDNEMKFFKASAEISKEKNILLTAHTSRGTAPEKRREMLHLLLDAGIDPGKLLLCHVHFTFWDGDFVSFFKDPNSKCLQLDWAREIMDLGVNISIDCFGEQPGPWDNVRLAGLITLLEEGYAKQIVIGNDVFMKTMTRSGGGFGYCGIIDYVIPELRKYGISQEMIDQITITNPQRLLSY